MVEEGVPGCPVGLTPADVGLVVEPSVGPTGKQAPCELGVLWAEVEAGVEAMALEKWWGVVPGCGASLGTIVKQKEFELVWPEAGGVAQVEAVVWEH